jgi:hypothetical protein
MRALSRGVEQLDSTARPAIKARLRMDATMGTTTPPRRASGKRQINPS